MKKIGVITFHASYNYGSNLQAYALQEYVKKICDFECEYKIINLRTDIQKKAYKNCFEKKNLKNRIKSIILLNKKKDFEKKEEYFEKFINNELNLTEEVKNIDDIKKLNLNCNYYISGSDQLWNIHACDFDWSNLLEFASNGKKISYAASFGPKAQLWTDEQKERIRKDLLEYDCLSVRENGSFNNVKELTGKEAEINIDPTMLLDKNEWNKIIEEKPIIKKDYILLYNLKNDKDVYKIAKIVSKELKMPVIITRLGNMKEIFMGFEKKYDVGPKEFLNLVKNAKLVLSSSFHGTVFSIILNKPFFAINGLKDFRIHTLLKKMNLENRTIEIENAKEKCESAFNIEFDESQKLIECEREKSRLYLERALDIKKE